jgi:hypothetical protein
MLSRRTLTKKRSIIAAVLLTLLSMGGVVFQIQSAGAAVYDSCNSNTCPAGQPNAHAAINFWYNTGWTQISQVITTATDANGNPTRQINGGGSYADRDGQLSAYFYAHGASASWVQAMEAHEYDVNDRPVGASRDAMRLVVAGVANEKYIFFTEDHYANFWYEQKL